VTGRRLKNGKKNNFPSLITQFENLTNNNKIEFLNNKKKRRMLTINQ